VTTAVADRVCVDASLYIAHIMPDEESAEATALLTAWQHADTEVFAPTLFLWECLNALRRAMVTQRLSDGNAGLIREEILALPVQLVVLEDRAEDIWSRFVLDLNLPTVYDATYLAVAHDLRCELWTEDRRLYRTVHERLPWVRCPSLEA